MLDAAHFKRTCGLLQIMQDIVLQVSCIVNELAQQFPTLHVTTGRKVLELRPKVDWDKGKALLHLVEALGLNEQSDVLPVYIGDDTTDEDAFRVLRENGVGILVSTKTKPTAARYTLDDPSQVCQMIHSVCSTCVVQTVA